MSAADDQHLHHQLKRAMGGVRRAVFTLYGLSFMFAVLGVSLAALVIKTHLRVRAIYAIAIVIFGFVGVIAVKAARRHQRAAAAAKAAEQVANQATQTGHRVIEHASNPAVIAPAGSLETGKI